VWLKDDIDDTAYFPCSDGSLRLDENPRVASYATLLVKGPDAATVTRSATAIEAAAIINLSIYSGHNFCSVLADKKIKSFNIKVTKAIMTKKSPRGKPEFNPTGQIIGQHSN